MAVRHVELGRVARPHGLRGEVAVKLHHADGETIFAAERLVLERPDGRTEERVVEGVRRGARCVLLRFAGVGDREAAETLRGAAISVPRSALPKAAADEVYLCDLIGAEVVAPDGPIGTIVEIRSHPTVDALVIRTADGATVEQPLCAPWVESVDVARGRVRLSSIEGLV